MTETSIATKDHETFDAPVVALEKTTVYVDDPDGKKFYEMLDHDAKCLTVGDLIIRHGQLRRVKDVRKKTVRGGIDWKVTLDNGFVFDPQQDEFSHKDSEPSNLRSIRFWRPRAGF